MPLAIHKQPSFPGPGRPLLCWSWTARGAASRAFEKGEWEVSQKEVEKINLKITPSVSVVMVMAHVRIRKAPEQIGRGYTWSPPHALIGLGKPLPEALLSSGTSAPASICFLSYI